MIHQYKLNGHNIVIDVYSGSVHLVDDVAYDIIRLFCEKTKEEIVDELLKKYGEGGDEILPEGPLSSSDMEECYEDVRSLKEVDKLFTEDEFRLSPEIASARKTDIKALCLHVAHACDLTCSYCFAGQGKFKGPSALMSAGVGKRAIDFLIENSGSHRNLEVDFFGGEPLLNFDVVKEIVAYARRVEQETGKNFRFTLTTNGMGIDDEVIKFANKECHNVVLSLDGRKEIHDRERITATGRGSYDIIVPKFQKLVAERMGKPCGGAVSGRGEEINSPNTNYYMRGTFTHYNPDFTNDVFHMTELGFTELSMEPVVTDPESRFALAAEDLEIVKGQYEILAKEMLKREREGSDEPGKQPFTFYHYMLDLAHGPCIYKRIVGCGSGTEYFAVTPQGDLYPCHQFVGDKDYLMGNIFDGITAVDIRDKFKACNVYARKECDDCWARLYCSGGCAANSYHATGDITGVYKQGCDLFKKRMECAIMMAAERSLWEEETSEEV